MYPSYPRPIPALSPTLHARVRLSPPPLLSSQYYHELIHMNHLPLLEDEPSAAHEHVSCADIMASPVATLPAAAPVGHVTTLSALLGVDKDDPKLKHAAFPVVDGEGKFVGLADAADLVALAASIPAAATPRWSVMDATDPQVACARAAQPAAAAFTLYRNLGQRHVPIVNAANEPVGMVTRHDLDAHKAEHVQHNRVAEGKPGCVQGVRKPPMQVAKGGVHRVQPVA